MVEIKNKELIKSLASRESVEARSEDLMNFITKLYGNKNFNILMDFVRIGLLAIAIIILIVLVGNINEVKILAGDVCKICIEKTGCDCTCINF